jgi:hypothetical protein
MNHFMARLIFCFFAEDTDIFNGTGVFTAIIEQMSARDSANTHEGDRRTLPRDEHEDRGSCIGEYLPLGERLSLRERRAVFRQQ